MADDLPTGETAGTGLGDAAADILTHYLRTTSLDKYRESMRNYATRVFAEQHVPEHKERMLQLEQRWLCTMFTAEDPGNRDGNYESSFESVIVVAPDRATAFSTFLMQTCGMQWRRDMVDHATADGLTVSAANATLFSQLRLETDDTKFTALTRQPNFEALLTEINSIRSLSFVRDWHIVPLSSVKEVRVL